MASLPTNEVEVEARPLQLYSCTVRPEWVDYNGHLRDAYYGLIFSLATDALMDHLGLDAAGRARHGGTLYTLESHACYLLELHEGAAVRVHTQLIAHDEKRLHVHHALWADELGAPAAVGECLLLHVATAGSPRATALPAPVMDAVQRLGRAHARLPAPPHVGRAVGLQRKARVAA